MIRHIHILPCAIHFTSYRKVCTCTRAWLGVRSNECYTWAWQVFSCPGVRFFWSHLESRLQIPSGSICLTQTCTVHISWTSVTAIMLSTWLAWGTCCLHSFLHVLFMKWMFMLTYRTQSALFNGTTYWKGTVVVCGIEDDTLCSEGIFVVTPHQ